MANNFLIWLNDVIPFNYALWKKSHDEFYYKLKPSLRKDWLSTLDPHFAHYVPLMVFILTFLIILWIESAYALFLYMFFGAFVIFFYQSTQRDFYNKLYINEKYLEMSKK